MLRELAVAIETIVLAKEERPAENLEGKTSQGGGEVGEGEGRSDREEGLRRRRRTRTRGAKSDVGDAEEGEESMQRVLDIVQSVLKVGDRCFVDSQS